MKIENQNSADFENLADLIQDSRITMMTTLDEDDRLVSRPMSPLKMDADGAIWFFTDLHSDKVQQIDRVNLSFSDDDDSIYVSVAGHGTVSTERAMIEELWTPLMKPWFPGGEESPNLALLKVTPQTAEYWDSTHNKMVRMFALATSFITSKPVDMGKHGKLNLMDSP
ncbi:MAG: stress protein [Burkholderiales bacterium PBB4]|nr:MAG: stress protein [Burkholderiales bacterium PBB4]